MQHLRRALLKFLINEFQRQPSICGTFHKICHTERINFFSWAFQWPVKFKNQSLLFGWWKRQESLCQTLMRFRLPAVADCQCHVSSGWLEALKHWGIISAQAVPQVPPWDTYPLKWMLVLDFPWCREGSDCEMQNTVGRWLNYFNLYNTNGNKAFIYLDICNIGELVISLLL